jgi:hypothetical protein
VKPVVFAGPTLSAHSVLASRAFAFRPPAAEGDIYRASLKQPVAIALIDGQFESVPSVWHKEVLWALSQGIAVYGAASMGALRAAELDRFGMIGIGSIYEAFRDGHYSDDDEVAILHAPRELGYVPLSLAMVDIRATLAAAVRERVVSPVLARQLTRIAKQTFFKDRTWKTILAGLKRDTAVRLRGWLTANAVDQKRADAIALLNALREFRPGETQPAFDFQSTVFWRALQQRHHRT